MKLRYDHPTAHDFHRAAAARKALDRGFDPPAVPGLIPDAEFQAGISEGNERMRVTLNGEPLPTAVAASESRHWALFIDDDGVRQRREGDVRIVAGD